MHLIGSAGSGKVGAPQLYSLSERGGDFFDNFHTVSSATCLFTSFLKPGWIYYSVSSPVSFGRAKTSVGHLLFACQLG